MIFLYIVENNIVVRKEIVHNDPLPDNIVWIDMHAPSTDEKKYIERCFNIDVLTSEEISRIEVMSPFYKSKESYYMTLTTIGRKDTQHFDCIAFTSVITTKCLITLHYDDIPALKTFTNLTKYEIGMYRMPAILLSAITEVFIHDVGEILEKTGNSLDLLIEDVFDKQIRTKGVRQVNNYNIIISKIGHIGNTISMSRESLVSINRLIIYFTQIEYNSILQKEHKLRLRHMAREIGSLTEYASFLAQRTSFLLDATLGLLSVEQNMVVKVFTIASAVLMPPTLIASVYGMNFRFMPETTWEYGYPLAVLLMLVSAILPYRYFKRKGWL